MKIRFANELATIKETMKRVFQGITHATTKTKILAISGAVVIVAATATGSMLLNKKGPDTVVSSPSSAVLEPAVTTLSLSQDTLTLEIGQTAQMSASPKPESSDKKMAVVWTSSDEKIATVSPDGLVTAVSKGTCTITASVDAAVSASAQITVQDPGEEEIALLKAYLKDGVKAPVTDLTFWETPVQVEATKNAAIVDLNGDNHYELLVEHFFICKDEYQSQKCPFLELYYVCEGKVVKGEQDFGRTFWEKWIPAGLGNSTGVLLHYLAQDTETGLYYFVENNILSEHNVTGLVGLRNVTVSSLNQDQYNPIMKMHETTYQDSEKFSYFFESGEVSQSEFEAALNKLKPVLFYKDEQVDQALDFSADSIHIYRNSHTPVSYLPSIKQSQPKKTATKAQQPSAELSDPSVLLQMDFEQIQGAYGPCRETDIHFAEGGDGILYGMDRYPYILRVQGNEVLVVLATQENAPIYRDAKIGMTYTQLKAVFGDNLNDLGENLANGDGTGCTGAIVGSIRYSLSFDSPEPTSKCTQVAIMMS